MVDIFHIYTKHAAHLILHQVSKFQNFDMLPLLYIKLGPKLDAKQKMDKNYISHNRMEN